MTAQNPGVLPGPNLGRRLANQGGKWQSAFSDVLFGRPPSFEPGSPKLAAAKLQWERPASLPGVRTAVWLVLLGIFLVWAWQGIQADPVKLVQDFADSNRVTKQFLDPDWSVLRIGIDATIETIQMAVMGVLIAAIISLPIGLLAAKNISHPVVYYFVRTILSFMRCIPEIVWAIIFVIIVGLGPWAGTLAIIMGTTGSFSKLFGGDD